MLDLLLADECRTATSLSEQLPVTRQAIAKHRSRVPPRVACEPSWLRGWRHHDGEPVKA
jgi:hypothetical protein